MSEEFGDDPAIDAEFAKADLMPASMTYRCPTCGKGDSVDIVEEDGLFTVPIQERFRECECGALIDIGWAGWHWHDGGAR